jgi:signal transduction histidine kinase
VFAEAAYPVYYQGRVARVIVYSAPVSDIVHNVTIVRQEIFVAGGIALLLALVGGFLVARALAGRVRRLERAAERVASGEFEHPIRVDSTDELGQLARAFNDMQRQLAQLESARKKFIATASHELRTPIFSLGGFVELLEDDELDAETRRRFLEQVREQVDRLRKLSVDLLDLSRLESGSLELRPEQVDLGELTRSVSGEFEPTLAQHDSHLELRLASRRIEASCDPVRVAQIMRILIDNALTHTPPGTRIVVTAAREDGHVRLAVRDDGEGIDADSLQRIFEPFFTADDKQGSGLGLAIASELAERMSGRLSVSSGREETVFTLEIPA